MKIIFKMLQCKQETARKQQLKRAACNEEFIGHYSLELHNEPKCWSELTLLVLVFISCTGSLLSQNKCCHVMKSFQYDIH